MYQLSEAVDKPFYENDEPEPKVRGSYYVKASLKEKVVEEAQDNDDFSSENQVIEDALKEYFSDGDKQ